MRELVSLLLNMTEKAADLRSAFTFLNVSCVISRVIKGRLLMVLVTCSALLFCRRCCRVAMVTAK